MPKVFHYQNHERWTDGAYSVFCPACGNEHPFDKKRWTFNGDFEKPTFTPSMLIKIDPSRFPAGLTDETFICHSFVTDGRIQYLGDCTHAMAGQTVDLPDIEA